MPRKNVKKKMLSFKLNKKNLTFFQRVLVSTHNGGVDGQPKAVLCDKKGGLRGCPAVRLGHNWANAPDFQGKRTTGPAGQPLQSYPTQFSPRSKEVPKVDGQPFSLHQRQGK